MKALIRIATKEYCYFEAEVEGSPEDIIHTHDELYTKYHGGFGLETKQWNVTLDAFLANGEMASDDYDAMNKVQQFVFQEIKKSFKRKNI